MDLAEFRCAPYGKALKRFQNKGAKPSYKRRLQFYYKTAKSWKNLLTSDIIESKKEGAQNDTKKLQNRNDKQKNRQKGNPSHTSRKQKTCKVSHLDQE